MSNLNRRGFLRGVSSVPLIGTAMAAEPYQPKKVASPRVPEVRHHSYPRIRWQPGRTAGFPGGLGPECDAYEGVWHASDDRPANRRSYSEADRRGIVAELAEGKTKVVITFDDLTRATPTFLIAPHVLTN